MRLSHSGCLSHGREKRTSTNCGGVSGAWFSTRMSIDQYAFPFKHVSPSEYATIRPTTVSTFEDSGKARLLLMRIPIDKKTLASGRITVEIVCLASRNCQGCRSPMCVRRTAEGGRLHIDQNPNPLRGAGSARFSQAGNNLRSHATHRFLSMLAAKLRIGRGFARKWIARLHQIRSWPCARAALD